MQLTIPLPFQANNPPHTRRNTVSDAANAELAVTAINRRGIWASTVSPARSSIRTSLTVMAAQGSRTRAELAPMVEPMLNGGLASPEHQEISKLYLSPKPCGTYADLW